MVFPWDPSDSKSLQVFKTLLSILADLNNAVVWMFSTRPLVFKSSSLSTNWLVIVPSAPITISITVSFMFHSFFSSLARSCYLSLFPLSFSFYPVMSHYSAGSVLFSFFFFFCRLSPSLIIWTRFGNQFLSPNPREFCASHFLGQILGWSNLNFLHNSQCITFYYSRVTMRSLRSNCLFGTVMVHKIYLVP